MSESCAKAAPSWAESSWPTLDSTAFGVLPNPDPNTGTAELLVAMRHATAGQSFLEWVRLRTAAALHAQMISDAPEKDLRRYDTHTRCAAAIATTHNLTQYAAERLLDCSLAAANRLPEVALCLRDGLIGARDLQLIVDRTDLVTDPEHQRAVDREVARILRRPGTWSFSRLRAMVDRTVIRVDPEGARRRREQARDQRSFDTDPLPDGMAQVSATMTAEDAITLARRVEAIADMVCPNDPRTRTARRSDALFALTLGIAWTCRCPAASGGGGAQGACTAPIPAPAGENPATPAVVITVVCDLETIIGDTDNPAFLDGHGVISAAHIADIIDSNLTSGGRLDRRRVRLRPLGGWDDPQPSCQPSEPYRPSTDLDRYVRIRDLYCTVPGCVRPAMDADLDHTGEFDHDHPARGGVTTAAVLGAKCRFHHNLKTHTDVLDDQYPGDDGRIRRGTVVGGLIVPGPAFTGEDMFTALPDIAFQPPPESPPPDSCPEAPPDRRRSRLADKHARRRAERARNRAALDAVLSSTLHDPPPF